MRLGPPFGLRLGSGSPARTAVCGALLATLFAGSSPCLGQLGPAPEPLNLFQLIARSDLIALVKVRDGTLKYAMVDLVEALKGKAPAPHLRIAFRDFNFTRRPQDDVIVFPRGRQSSLRRSAGFPKFLSSTRQDRSRR